MTLLHIRARSSLLSLPASSSRCMSEFARRMSTETVAKPRFRSRSVVVSNILPSFTMRQFLALKGAGRSIESVSVNPEKQQVEINYLFRRGPDPLFASKSKNELVLDGQALDVQYLDHRPLPVEVIAAIGLKGASRKIIVNQLPKRDAKWTEKDLMEEMSRFGTVENVWLDEAGEKATVTFSDILTAVKAHKTLRIEEGVEAGGVRFYFDATKSRNPDASTEEDGSRTVYLSGLPLDITPARLLKDLKPLFVYERGEPLANITMHKNTAFLQFTFPSLAKLFYDSYRPTRGIEKAWARSENNIGEQLLSAVKLGATRTVYISKFNDPRINFERLKEDFSKFGRIATVYVDWKSRQAFIEFCDIPSACKAIDHIAENNRNFSIYADAHFNFGKHIKYGEKLHLVQPLVIATAESQKVAATA